MKALRWFLAFLVMLPCLYLAVFVGGVAWIFGGEECASDAFEFTAQPFLYVLYGKDGLR